MVGAERLVPLTRRALLRRLRRPPRRAGPRARRVSRRLTTLALRSLNQQVADGRLPEAVGGEFVEANGLDRGRRPRRGARASSSATSRSPRPRRSRISTRPRCAARATASAYATSTGSGPSRWPRSRRAASTPPSTTAARSCATSTPSAAPGRDAAPPRAATDRRAAAAARAGREPQPPRHAPRDRGRPRHRPDLRPRPILAGHLKEGQTPFRWSKPPSVGGERQHPHRGGGSAGRGGSSVELLSHRLKKSTLGLRSPRPRHVKRDSPSLRSARAIGGSGHLKRV